MHARVSTAILFVGVWFVAGPIGSRYVWSDEHTQDSNEKVMAAVKEKKAILVDVRERKEWDAGHLKGAKLVPLSVLKRDATADDIRKLLPKDLPKGSIVYLHCASGYRCLEAAPLLRKHGYEVRALASGYKDLLKAGWEKAPEEKPASKDKPSADTK